MAEEFSHPTNPPAHSAEDISLQNGTTSAPVQMAGDSGNPAALTSVPNPSPDTSAAGKGSGGTGETIFDYEASKAALLADMDKPAPPVTVVPETPATPAAPVVPAAPGPETVEGESSRHPAIKIRPTDEGSMQALLAYKEYQKSGGTNSLIDWAAAQRQPELPLGPVVPAVEVVVETGTPLTPGDKPVESLTPAEIRARIEQIGADLQVATEGFELGEMGRLQNLQTKLMLALPEAMQREMQQQSAQQTQQQELLSAFEVEVNKFASQAASLFGQDVYEPDSPLTKRANEVLAQMELAGDPVAFTPSATLVIYAQAAADLGIQPGSAQAPPVVNQTVSPVPPVAPFSILAGGDGRTHTASRSAMPEVTPENYEAHKAALLKRIA